MTRNHTKSVHVLGWLPSQSSVTITIETEDYFQIEPERPQTVEHEHIGAYTRLSITGVESGTSGSSGQIIDLAASVGRPGPGWTMEDVRSLVELWRRWHLNDLNAGCVHMDTTGLGEDFDSRRHLVCEETGYRYGTSWLVEDLPEDVRREVRRLQALSQVGEQ